MTSHQIGVHSLLLVCGLNSAALSVLRCTRLQLTTLKPMGWSKDCIVNLKIPWRHAPMIRTGWITFQWFFWEYVQRGVKTLIARPQSWSMAPAFASRVNLLNLQHLVIYNLLQHSFEVFKHRWTMLYHHQSNTIPLNQHACLTLSLQQHMYMFELMDIVHHSNDHTPDPFELSQPQTNTLHYTLMVVLTMFRLIDLKPLMFMLTTIPMKVTMPMCHNPRPPDMDALHDHLNISLKILWPQLHSLAF